MKALYAQGSTVFRGRAFSFTIFLLEVIAFCLGNDIDKNKLLVYTVFITFSCTLTARETDMCQGRVRSMQRGVPMTRELFETFDQEQQAFWDEFHAEARKAIEKAEASGDARPFTPPASLAELHRKAVDVYDGQKYCHVRQLEEIFAF